MRRHSEEGQPPRYPVARYLDWPHLRWPAGTVEDPPEVPPEGSTAVPGLYVVGDLTGCRCSRSPGTAGRARCRRSWPTRPSEAGFGGRHPGPRDRRRRCRPMAAALEARHHDLRSEVLEASEPFSMVVNFPRENRSTRTRGDGASGRAPVHRAILLQGRARRGAGRDDAGSALSQRLARAERVGRDGDRLMVHVAGGELLRAHRVIVGIGRSATSGSWASRGRRATRSPTAARPQDYCARSPCRGGGDSALEAASPSPAVAPT